MVVQVRGAWLDVEWYKTIGSPSTDTTEIFYGVTELSDGNFVATGYQDPSILPEFYLAKTDKQGKVIWERKYLDTHFKKAVGYSLLKTSDGGFYVGGSSSLLLGRFNADGDTVWTRDINKGKLNAINSIIQMNNDEISVLGGKAKLPVLFNDPDNYAFIVRMGTNGDSISLTEYLFGTSAFSLSGTSDNGSVFGGDKIIVKSDSVVEQQWKKEFTSPSGMQERYLHVIESSQGGYIALGSYYADTDYWEVRLRKLNALGVREWETGFYSQTWGYDICEVLGTGYVFLARGTFGETEVYLVDYAGNLLHHLKTEDIEIDDWSFLNIEATSDLGVILCGSSTKEINDNKYKDALIVKLRIDTTTHISNALPNNNKSGTSPILQQKGSELQLTLSGPVQSKLTVQLYTPSGQLVKSQTISATHEKKIIIKSNIATGVYQYRIIVDKRELFGTVFIQ